MNVIEAYLVALPEDQRAVLDHIRRIIRATCPEAVEDLGYGMPRFKYRAKPLMAVAAWKDHLSLYGGWDAVGRVGLEAAGFEIKRSTIQLRWGKPLPEAVLGEIVRARMADIDAQPGARRQKFDR